MSALSELPRVALAADWAVDTLDCEMIASVENTARRTGVKL